MGESYVAIQSGGGLPVVGGGGILRKPSLVLALWPSLAFDYVMASKPYRYSTPDRQVMAGLQYIKLPDWPDKIIPRGVPSDWPRLEHSTHGVCKIGLMQHRTYIYIYSPGHAGNNPNEKRQKTNLKILSIERKVFPFLKILDYGETGFV